MRCPTPTLLLTLNLPLTLTLLQKSSHPEQWRDLLARIADANEQWQALEAAFDQLPDDYREAVVLRRIVGLDYADLAAAMERSQGAVRNLVHRGVARLSTLLDSRDDGHG